LEAACALLAVFLYLPRLGTLPFYTKAEPREAIQVWDEVNRSEWILPLRNGVELPSKPPLFHWLGGLASWPSVR
jgi:4-amino-4-deoxy-L-arabinose transferase-like glycosyltransferase